MPETETRRTSRRTMLAAAATVVWVCAMGAVLRAHLLGTLCADPAATCPESFLALVRAAAVRDLGTLSDFLGGAVAAPVAFLWLVVGYFQQGHELHLQVQETQHLVGAAVRQVDLIEAEHRRAETEKQPRFTIREQLRRKDGGLVGAIINLGGRAEEVEVSSGGPHTMHIDMEGRVATWPQDQPLTIRIEMLEQDNPQAFSLSYRDALFRNYDQEFRVTGDGRFSAYPPQKWQPPQQE